VQYQINVKKVWRKKSDLLGYANETVTAQHVVLRNIVD